MKIEKANRTQIFQAPSIQPVSVPEPQRPARSDAMERLGSAFQSLASVAFEVEKQRDLVMEDNVTASIKQLQQQYFADINSLSKPEDIAARRAELNKAIETEKQKLADRNINLLNNWKKRNGELLEQELNTGEQYVRTQKTIEAKRYEIQDQITKMSAMNLTAFVNKIDQDPNKVNEQFDKQVKEILDSYTKVGGGDGSEFNTAIITDAQAEELRKKFGHDRDVAMLEVQIYGAPEEFYRASSQGGGGTPVLKYKHANPYEAFRQLTEVKDGKHVYYKDLTASERLKYITAARQLKSAGFGSKNDDNLFNVYHDKLTSKKPEDKAFANKLLSLATGGRASRGQVIAFLKDNGVLASYPGLEDLTPVEMLAFRLKVNSFQDNFTVQYDPAADYFKQLNSLDMATVIGTKTEQGLGVSWTASDGTLNPSAIKDERWFEQYAKNRNGNTKNNELTALSFAWQFGQMGDSEIYSTQMRKIPNNKASSYCSLAVESALKADMFSSKPEQPVEQYKTLNDTIRNIYSSMMFNNKEHSTMAKQLLRDSLRNIITVHNKDNILELNSEELSRELYNNIVNNQYSSLFGMKGREYEDYIKNGRNKR